MNTEWRDRSEMLHMLATDALTQVAAVAVLAKARIHDLTSGENCADMAVLAQVMDAIRDRAEGALMSMRDCLADGPTHDESHEAEE